MIGFLASLTVAAQALALAVLVAWLVQRFTARAPHAWLRDRIGADAGRLAAFVALVGMGGSLYFSERLHFLPCPLCWYQRIAMYSLAVILSIAAIRRDHDVRWYALPLAGIGAAISTYHYQLERFPEQEALACSSSVPCTTIWFERFGYITIPMMALSAFIAIAALLSLTPRSTNDGQGIKEQG